MYDSLSLLFLLNNEVIYNTKSSFAKKVLIGNHNKST